MTVQRIGRDQGTGEAKLSQQRLRGRDFVGFVVDVEVRQVDKGRVVPDPDREYEVNGVREKSTADGETAVVSAAAPRNCCCCCCCCAA